MASATETPFRFLDLPAELRCCVYENIEIPTTWQVLDRAEALVSPRWNRTEAFISESAWPVPPKAQVYDSRVVLIRPRTPLAIEILVTCHLINIEARPILKAR